MDKFYFTYPSKSLLFALKVSRFQNMPRTPATLHLCFHVIGRIRKPGEKLLSPADLNSLKTPSRASPSSLRVLHLYRFLCDKYNIYTQSRVKRRNQAHCMPLGFGGDLWSPTWQSIAGEAKEKKKENKRCYHCNHNYFPQQ